LKAQTRHHWMGKSSLDLTGFVAPRGFSALFVGHGEYDYVKAYFDMAATLPKPPIWSRPGLVAEVERTLGAKLLSKGSGFEVMRDGERICTLSSKDLDALQHQLIDAARNAHFSVKLPASVGE